MATMGWYPALAYSDRAVSTAATPGVGSVLEAGGPDLLADEVDRRCLDLARKLPSLPALTAMKSAVDEAEAALETLPAVRWKWTPPARKTRQSSRQNPIRRRFPSWIGPWAASVFPSESREAASLHSRQSCLPVRNLLEDSLQVQILEEERY